MSRQSIRAFGKLALALVSVFGLAHQRGRAQDQPKTGATEKPAAAHADAADASHAPAEHGGAKGHGGGGDPDILEPQPSLALWTVLVFFGLFFVLGRYAWKPLLAALHQREEHLEQVLLDTERARNESEQLLAEHRRRLAASEEQIRGLIAEAKATAQAVADEIIKRAQEQAEASKHRAERDIATARDQALAEIWSKTADLAVSVAGKVLSKSLSADEHRRLIEVAIAELPAQANGHGGHAG